MSRRRDLRPEQVPPPRPSIPWGRVDGYELRPVAVGYEVWLTYGAGSIVSAGPWWALTEAGAHRRARRAVERERRRERRRESVRRYEA